MSIAPTALLTAFFVAAAPMPAVTLSAVLVDGGVPVVDASALGDMGKELAPKVEEATKPILEEAGYDASAVRISVGWLNADEFHYAVKVALDPATPTDQAPLTATCRDCSSAQLVEAAVAGVHKAIAQRPEGPPKAEPAPVEPPEPTEGSKPRPEGDDAPAQDKASKKKAGPLRPLGWAGVGTMIGGAVALGTGGAFVALGERRPADDMSQIRDFRPAGYGLLGVGGALLITGSILLGVERAKSKKQANAAAVLPFVGPRSAGVSWLGRF